MTPHELALIEATRGPRVAKAFAALEEGAKTRAELLRLTGGSVNKMQAALQRLVAEGVVVRLGAGRYSLPTNSED